jgi:hypothetical protein
LEAQADRENKFSEAVREMTGQAHTLQMEESAERNSKLVVAADQTAPDVARAIHSLSGPCGRPRRHEDRHGSRRPEAVG